MKISIVQMTVKNDLKANLEKMKRCLEAAKDEGAELVAFPEMAYFMGSREECLAVIPRYEEVVAEFSEWAKLYKMWILPGSVREPALGDSRAFNTAVAIDPTGSCVARYRKIHLFQAALPDRRYDERKECEPGKEIVVFPFQEWKIGLSICYDVRFPELFRALKRGSADLVLVPAAFTVPTGEAHWETLLRARAIENQVFILAPAQVGLGGNGAKTYGHSLAISPWGDVLSDLGEKEAVRTLTLSRDSLLDAASKVDCWASRRDDVFFK